MNLNQLQYFVTLANYEHYTKAAEQLSITQPTLSHAIRMLEEELGTSLFRKQGRNVVLSKYGKIFLQYAQDSLHVLNLGVKKIQSMTDDLTGHIDLAYIYTMGREFAPQMVRGFLEHCNHCAVEFQLTVLNTSEIIRGIKEERFDVGFCSIKDDETTLEFVPVWKEELVVVVPKNHPLSAQKTIDLKETVPYPQVYYPSASGLRPVIDKLYKSIDEKPSIAYEIEEDSSMAGLVEEGFGIAVMPNIPLLSHINVNILSISSPEFERYVYMVYLKNGFLSPSVHNFIEYVKGMV